MTEKSLSSSEESALTIGEAEQRILLLRQHIYMIGANDSEFSQIDQILNKLRAGELSPEGALEEAERVESVKSDYH